MAHNQFRWYEYKGRGIKFSTTKGELRLKTGLVFGLRTVTDKYYVTDVENKITIRIEAFDYNRLIANSKGFTGVVGKQTLKPGIGVLDKKDREDGYVRIDSGMFTRGKYDAKKKTLTLEFRNGAVWQYRNVTAKEVMAFEKAKSQGAYFNEVIKGEKESQRMQSLSSGESAGKYGIYELSDLPERMHLIPSETPYTGDRVTLKIHDTEIHWCVVKDWKGSDNGVFLDLFVPMSPACDYYTVIYNVPRSAVTPIVSDIVPQAKDLFGLRNNCSVSSDSFYTEEDVPPAPESAGAEIGVGDRVTYSWKDKSICNCVVGSVEPGSADVASSFGLFVPILPGSYLKVPKVPLTALTRDTYTAVASSGSIAKHGLYEVSDLPEVDVLANYLEGAEYKRGERVKVQLPGNLVESCVVYQTYNVQKEDGDYQIEYTVCMPVSSGLYTLIRGIPQHALSPCGCGPKAPSIFQEDQVSTASGFVSESNAYSKSRWRMWEPSDLPPEPEAKFDGRALAIGARVSLQVMNDGTMVHGCVVLESYMDRGRFEYVIAAPFAGKYLVQINNVQEALLRVPETLPEPSTSVTEAST